MTEADVLAALKQVDDPEVGINVVDLGLVYGVSIDGDTVRVELTMTTPACPLGDHIVDAAEQAIRSSVPGAGEVAIELVWDPPWAPDRMSEAARRELGWS